MTDSRTLALALVLTVGAAGLAAQAPAPAPTDRTKATHFSAADLQAAMAKLPTDRPASSVRVFSLTPYNVNVERRLPQVQGASLHEAQAEFFYVVEGSGTMLTGGTMVNPTRNGTNLSAKTIEGGVRQVLNKGDFFIVPSGVPHQFVDLTGPLQVMAIYLPNQP
jgi:mannose-6-phosphate isomerase-like protein (cupin superfamily)